MKNEALRFWVQKVSQNIWLHYNNSNELKKKLGLIVFSNLVLISSLFFLFNTKNLFEFICLVGLFIENEIISFFFLKNIFKHNEAKCRYKIFLEETNQELKLSSEDTLNFILYKKLELDKLIKLSPEISETVLNKYKKKFKKNILVTDFSKIPSKYSLYEKTILIKYFNRLKSRLKKHICNAYYLGPFYKNRRFLYEFQNVKMGDNDIQISIE